MAIIPTGLTLDAVADFLDGSRTLESYTKEEQSFLTADEWDLNATETYPLSKTLFLKTPKKLTGNGAVVRCRKQKYAIYVVSGDVTVQKLDIQNVQIAIVVDPMGAKMEHVHVLDNVIHLEMEGDFEGNIVGVEFGSSRSNAVMRDIHIARNTIYGSAGWEENELALNIPISVAAAVGRDNTPLIENCLLEDVYIEGNRCFGGIRVAYNLICTTFTWADMGPTETRYRNCTVRRAHLNHNYAEECWDGIFNVICGFYASESPVMEDVEIAHNSGGFGITSLYMYAAEPLIGANSGAVLRRVDIHDNSFTHGDFDSGEPVRGFFLAGGRTDYYEHTHASGALMEQVRIHNNTLKGGGLVLCGAYSLLDGVGLCENNCMRDVHCYDNTFTCVDYAFILEGANAEGRRYDWNFGYPRHDHKWLDPLDNDDQLLMQMRGNRLENVLIENNTIDGYRYRVVAAGADVRGHALASDNSVSANIIMRNNTFLTGEAHVRVSDYIGEDWCRDGGGNSVDPALRKR